MTRVGKYFRLARAERRLLREAYATVAAMRVLTWALPYGRVREVAATMTRRSVGFSTQARPTREAIARSVMATGNAFPGGRNCLVRALAAEVMLGRYHYPAELKIGVANPETGSFKAHAWLESEGSVVIGDFELESYVPLGRREGASPK
jgi:hypothetical protein